MQKISIYLEIGKKKTIAVALDWLGFYRIGNNEEEALESFVEYGNRYAEILKTVASTSKPPPA